MSLQVERVKVSELTPDAENVRKHDARNLEAIKKSLERFGQQKPLVVDGDGVTKAGNGTLLAAIDLGWEEIDVVRTQLSGAELKAYAVADNKTSDLSEFNFEELAGLFKELQAEDETLLEMTGFADYEIEPLLSANWEPPEVEPLPGKGTGHSLSFSEEQWQVVIGAMKHVRGEKNDETITCAQAVTHVLQDALPEVQEQAAQ